MKKIITITTDYGDQFATSQLKAVIFGLGFEGEVIENHDVKKFSTVEGAYAIWQISKHCPQNTIHVGVIDPEVGSKRKGLIIKTKKFWFVGPDNGHLWHAANKNKIFKVWKINEAKFGKVRKTFHGRDIFVKAAVWISQGKKPEELGCHEINKENIKRLNFNDGQIVHIDNYGNIKIWGKKTFGLPLVKTFSDVKIGKPLILNGSSDTLEVAINQGSAEEYFGLKLGQVINKLE